MAHARRYFFELHANHQRQIAGHALHYIAQLYEIEREVKHLCADERQRIRQARSKPLTDALHQWMVLQRSQILDRSATAKALDYSLRRWGALIRFLDDGQLPINNNWVENQIWPVAVGCSNWLFARSLRAGHCAASIVSLIQSAKLNGHDPYAHLKDVLTKLPTQKNSQMAQLLPHRWQPAQAPPCHNNGAGFKVYCPVAYRHSNASVDRTVMRGTGCSGRRQKKKLIYFEFMK